MSPKSGPEKAIATQVPESRVDCRDSAGILPGEGRPMGQVVRFGNFSFDRESGQLWSGSAEQRLTPKSAAVLRTLLASPGQPVTKQVLFDTVWKGTVVSDDALTSCIQELRRALRDDP